MSVLPCDIEKKDQYPAEAKTIIGIDVGLEHFATIASEEGIKEIKSH